MRRRSGPFARPRHTRVDREEKPTSSFGCLRNRDGCDGANPWFITLTGAPPRRLRSGRRHSAASCSRRNVCQRGPIRAAVPEGPLGMWLAATGRPRSLLAGGARRDRARGGHPRPSVLRDGRMGDQGRACIIQRQPRAAARRLAQRRSTSERKNALDRCPRSEASAPATRPLAFTPDDGERADDAGVATAMRDLRSQLSCRRVFSGSESS